MLEFSKLSFFSGLSFPCRWAGLAFVHPQVGPSSCAGPGLPSAGVSSVHGKPLMQLQPTQLSQCHTGWLISACAKLSASWATIFSHWLASWLQVYRAHHTQFRLERSPTRASKLKLPIIINMIVSKTNLIFIIRFEIMNHELWIIL